MSILNSIFLLTSSSWANGWGKKGWNIETCSVMSPHLKLHRIPTHTECCAIILFVVLLPVRKLAYRNSSWVKKWWSKRMEVLALD